MRKRLLGKEMGSESKPPVEEDGSECDGEREGLKLLRSAAMKVKSSRAFAAWEIGHECHDQSIVEGHSLALALRHVHSSQTPAFAIR